MADFDLTSKLAKFLDCHMVEQLLNHLMQQKMYPEKDILRAKYVLLSKTKMIDYTNSIFKKLNDTVEDMPNHDSSRTNVLKQLQSLSEEAHEAVAVIEEAEAQGILKLDRQANCDYLQENGLLDLNVQNKIYDYALLLYQCGSYKNCSRMLNAYRYIAVENSRYMAVLWGLFACEILSSDWEKAWELLRFLQDTIESTRAADAVSQLLNRVYLIHWSLFPFFNHPQGREGIVNLFFQKDYINSISKECPWILRYLAAAVISNQRKRQMIPELARVIERERYQYCDPITDFIENLYVKMDFNSAQNNLAKVSEVLKNDFFLQKLADDFIANARLFMFESYVRIHANIDIGDLSRRLNMNNDEGERWIVNLIRNARLDAKIDTSTNTVIMGYNAFSSLTSAKDYQLSQQQQLERSMRDGGMYQVIIDKTKGLLNKSQELMNNLDKKDTDGEPHRRHAKGDHDKSMTFSSRRNYHGNHYDYKNEKKRHDRHERHDRHGKHKPYHKK